VPGRLLAWSRRAGCVVDVPISTRLGFSWQHGLQSVECRGRGRANSSSLRIGGLTIVANAIYLLLHSCFEKFGSDSGSKDRTVFFPVSMIFCRVMRERMIWLSNNPLYSQYSVQASGSQKKHKESYAGCPGNDRVGTYRRDF
jgi:hypothetical protein